MIKKSFLNFLNYKNQFKIIKTRILFLMIALIMFRAGSFVPIPGINPNVLSLFLQKQHGTIIEMFNMFSGGALNRASIFSLGIMPYISSSIIIQLLTIIYPSLTELKKEGGELGRKKINQYTRYCTILLATLQSIIISTHLERIHDKFHNLVISPGLLFYFTSTISLITGTIILMWIGEQITKRGIGNGVSIIIFSGIIAGLPASLFNTIQQIKEGDINILFLILILSLMFAITFVVLFIECSQREIIVNYAKKQQGRRIYSSQSTHLPIKINMSGVIPAIFSSSIILFPSTISSWLGQEKKYNWLSNISFYLQPGQTCYILLYSFLIMFFCFFYTSLVFNPKETSENLKKSGAFIPGIRPGNQTAKYIEKIITRLTLFGSLYITIICLIPDFMRLIVQVPFYFGGTSLLIVVVVIMDFITQIKTLMLSNKYETVLKKSNFKIINDSK